MGEVLTFPGQTRLDLNPAQMAENIDFAAFESVCIVGCTEAGDIQIFLSKADPAQSHFMLCQAAQSVLMDTFETGYEE